MTSYSIYEEPLIQERRLIRDLEGLHYLNVIPVSEVGK
jgi:hypothetical protein